MSAQPVDVLAVMDVCANLLRDKPANMPQTAADLRETRAAVAELVEAARAADELIGAWERNHGGSVYRGGYMHPDRSRLRAALARVGGAL